MEAKEPNTTHKFLLKSQNVLLVVTIEEDLKKGGIAVLLIDQGDNEFAIVVPNHQYDEAVSLLRQQKPNLGELFSVQKE